jgi:hypothetical protein
MTAKDFDDGMDKWETGVWPVAYANCDGTEDMPTGILNTVLGYPSVWDGTLLAPTQLAPTTAAQQYRQYRPMRYQPPRRGIPVGIPRRGFSSGAGCFPTQV